MVTKYEVLFYGTPSGIMHGPRAMITLYEGRQGLGYIRFWGLDVELPGETQGDTESQGLITMNLPLAMFANVIDTLRNEKPINFYFTNGRAHLSTFREPVGEAE